MNINVFYIIYLYVPAVNEKKEAINMKNSNQVYTSGFGRRKGKNIQCNYIMISKCRRNNLLKRESYFKIVVNANYDKL